MQSKIPGNLSSLPHGRNRHHLTSIMNRREISVIEIPSPPQLRLLFFRSWSQSCGRTPLRIMSTKNSDHHRHTIMHGDFPCNVRVRIMNRQIVNKTFVLLSTNLLKSDPKPISTPPRYWMFKFPRNRTIQTPRKSRKQLVKPWHSNTHSCLPTPIQFRENSSPNTMPEEDISNSVKDLLIFL